MQLLAMHRVREQEQELRQLSAILKQMKRKIHNPPIQADAETTSDSELPPAP